MGHILRKEEDDVVRNALKFNVEGRRKRGRPKRTWRKQVKEERLKARLNLKDVHNRTKWIERVRAISMRSIRPPPLNGDYTGQWHHHYHLVSHFSITNKAIQI